MTPTIATDINASFTAAAAAAVAAAIATVHCRSECGVLAQLVLFTVMVPHSKAMPNALREQHAARSNYASCGFEGAWPQQHTPEAVKPVETICLKDGSLADIAVVGEIFFTLICQWLALSYTAKPEDDQS